MARLVVDFVQGAQNGSMNAADGGAMKVAMCCKHLGE
jgi:hypothetical protein